MRIVVDTSVVVSALLLPGSTPRRAFDRARQSGVLLSSGETVDELNAVLRRPKFNTYITEEQRLEFLAAMIQEAEIVLVTTTVLECRDPKDNKFLELAISGQATHVLTGDSDLLELHPFRGIAVVTPQQFLTESAAE
ncbi:MAG: putative toxin-antitoxin system toxin component, PIN family [Planctomycetaceae bacterium]|nr:putative toxin-antitoxin system toxin component, PIN family [Planctomycetaceae bacterium]